MVGECKWAEKTGADYARKFPQYSIPKFRNISPITLSNLLINLTYSICTGYVYSNAKSSLNCLLSLANLGGRLIGVHSRGPTLRLGWIMLEKGGLSLKSYITLHSRILILHFTHHSHKFETWTIRFTMVSLHTLPYTEAHIILKKA